jgi:hypothetical protein
LEDNPGFKEKADTFSVPLGVAAHLQRWVVSNEECDARGNDKASPISVRKKCS